MERRANEMPYELVNNSLMLVGSLAFGGGVKLGVCWLLVGS